jgi:hypothetical protein
MSSEARSAATSWHSAEAGLAVGVEAAGVVAVGVVEAGDDGAAEVVLPDPLAAPDVVVLDPQATVTSPAASATAQTFQADQTSVIPLMSPQHRLSRPTGPHPRWVSNYERLG